MISPLGFPISLLTFGYWISLLILWLGFSIAIGIGANTRGRGGVSWFFLALLISPPLAGIVLLGLPSRASHFLELGQHAPKFEADGMLSGIPYRQERDGRVELLMPGGIAVFQSMDQLVAASGVEIVENQPAETDEVSPNAEQMPEVVNGFRYRLEKNGQVSALSPSGHEMKFQNMTEFWAAAHGQAQRSR